MKANSAARPLSLPYKLLLGAAAMILAVAGVVGLLIPVLPGLLFLAGAAGCLCLASRRCNAYLQRLLQRYPRHRETLGRWRAGSGLPLGQRVKLAGLLAARSILPGEVRR